MDNFFWFIWVAGFGTGAFAAYLGCILFCRRILREEGELVAFLQRKADSELDDAALRSFVKAWKWDMEGRG